MCARACERMSLWEETLSLLDSANDRFLGMKKNASALEGPCASRKLFTA